MHRAQPRKEISTPAPEHKYVAAERIFLQRRLYSGSQTTEAGAHVGGADGQPHFGAGGQADLMTLSGELE